MFRDIVLCYLLQIGFTFGVIFIVGWLISLCNKAFYNNFGIYGNAVCYITGFVGTPVHELSHALFCVVFGHKITEIKLFQISDDGTLGYVNHSYNPDNVYQRIGNFFIGIAPITVISVLLYLLASALIPTYTESIREVSESILSFNAGEIAVAFKKSVIVFFGGVESWRWWIFLLVGIFLSLHAALSGADIRNMLDGLWIILLVLLISDVILRFIKKEILFSFTSAVVWAGTVVTSFLFVLLALSLIAVVISLIFRYVLTKKK